MPRTNYLLKLSFSYHRQLAKPSLIVAYILLYSFLHAKINWQWSIKGRVFITLWVVSIRGSLSCALKRKEDWCYSSNAKHTSKGLYLPILTNERSSARMIGQTIALPFLLFLFHTIKRDLSFIDIGASGSTPTHQPFMELPDQEKKIHRYHKESKKGLWPIERESSKWLPWRGRNDHRQAQDSKFESLGQSILEFPFPLPRALAVRVDTKEIYYVNWHDPLLTHEPSSKSQNLIETPWRPTFTLRWFQIDFLSTSRESSWARYTLEERERSFPWGNGEISTKLKNEYHSIWIHLIRYFQGNWGYLAKL